MTIIDISRSMSFILKEHVTHSLIENAFRAMSIYLLPTLPPKNPIKLGNRSNTQLRLPTTDRDELTPLLVLEEKR